MMRKTAVVLQYGPNNNYSEWYDSIKHRFGKKYGLHWTVYQTTGQPHAFVPKAPVLSRPAQARGGGDGGNACSVDEEDTSNCRRLLVGADSISQFYDSTFYNTVL